MRCGDYRDRPRGSTKAQLDLRRTGASTLDANSAVRGASAGWINAWAGDVEAQSSTLRRLFASARLSAGAYCWRRLWSRLLVDARPL